LVQEFSLPKLDGFFNHFNVNIKTVLIFIVTLHKFPFNFCLIIQILESVPRIVALVSSLAFWFSCHPKHKQKHKPKQFFKDRALFFLMGEESSQPTKKANKIIILIFLFMKATILDTLGLKVMYVQ